MLKPRMQIYIKFIHFELTVINGKGQQRINQFYPNSLDFDVRIDQFLYQYKYFLQHSILLLQLLLIMDKLNEHAIFFEEKHSTTFEDAFPKQVNCPLGIPYLKKGDSNIYLDQFLAKDQEILPEASPKTEEMKKQKIFSEQSDESFQIQDSAKFNPSAFHNFQKHLTVCLKHSILITSEDKTTKEYQSAAAKLWKTFKNSNVSTKKILHFLLGQKNEHAISDEGLKEYGLLKIYQAYSPITVKEARNYLANQTLRQIREGKLEDYINAKKLKNKEQFKKYVDIFVEQLQNGYLRKRLPKDKVAYLLSL